ncbi:MAG: hypothetical protein RLZ95_756 [Bacteroidota bacterium]|jgi:hypothetical protein
MRFVAVCLSLVVLVSTACNSKKSLFTKLDASTTGIEFNNEIIETDSLNVLDISNIYNGGGVGIGDFNGDGLSDIYFTGNKVANKLYLNKGALHFEDITSVAGVEGEGKWSRGVSVVDINNDGKSDIYISATLGMDTNLRKNILYINQGNDAKGAPHFKNMAAEYGLADTSYSTMANFFDYDNDGDLDMFLVVNEIKDPRAPNIYHPKSQLPELYSTSKLFQNNWDENLKHPVFEDVTAKAGLIKEGYGHSVVVTDINKDGWKDIYVTNDYLPNDYLYINNHDGTFSDKLNDYFKHTSVNSMGTDVADVNNDGLMDFITLDMNPRDNFRKKMMMNPNSYQTFQNNDLYGYNYQYVRNTLQINQGPRVNGNDSVGAPIFSEIAYMSGIAETDWSWTPLLADLDNDGHRDLFVTNGFPKDVTDHDFIMYRFKAFSYVSKSQLLKEIPEVKIHNYVFKNNGNLTFDDKSIDWGFETPTYSNGAVYADLDNDGDLDFVINNINDKASVYENKQRQLQPEASHYLRFDLQGEAQNLNAIGAEIAIYYDHGKKQVAEQSPYRGYLSTLQNTLHFGLGKIASIDSAVVIWPNGQKQVLAQTKADQTIKLSIKNANAANVVSSNLLASNTLFTDVTAALGVKYVHTQNDYVDFNIQKLIPHKFSEYAPAVAVGDVDGNGLEDMVIGGSVGNSAQILLQQQNGGFIQKDLLAKPLIQSKQTMDEGLLLMDADGDNDLDLIITSGGYEQIAGSDAYLDKMYLNDGKGNFTVQDNVLPANKTSKLCIKSVDYDKDGDLDLFIGGRVDPSAYPKPVSSFIYRNDSQNGVVKFTDVSSQVAKDLNKVGLVCDALFSDFDNDGWFDLILTGEWMPITFLKNDKGIFKNVTASSGVDKQVGWWNSIVSGDFDNDGDLDYIVGNLGANSYYKASDKHPAVMYANDFDKNGSYDAFPGLFLPISQVDTTRKLFPAQTREDAVKQMIGMRSKYQNFKTFAGATLDDLFTKEQMKEAQILKANYFNSSYLQNNGNGKFTITSLPLAAQVSTLNGMQVDDFNGDGNLDIAINGNDFGTEVSVGRYDALNGLVMIGDGKGGFAPKSILESGLFLPGNGKALVKFTNAKGEYLMAASQNKGPLKIYKSKLAQGSVNIMPNEVAALVTYANGKTRKEEFYYGQSFLSQSSRFILKNDKIKSITIIDNKGNKRTI